MSRTIGPQQATAVHQAAEDEMDIVESDGEEAAANADPIQISLSFGGNLRGGGAWDDRELINSYNAAMSEFHRHHPGPGTWLDKATAALAKGRPLPGAEEYDTAWYSASYVEPSPDPTTSPEPDFAGPAKKKQKPSKPKPKPKAATNGAVNPYAPVASSSKAQVAQNGRGRQPSPSFVPPSPPASGDLPAAAADEDEEGEEEWYDESYALEPNEEPHTQAGPTTAVGPPHASSSAPQGGNHAPVFGPQSAEGVSSGEAMGYAMTAQYWAGYWMGVAQARVSAPVVSTSPKPHQPTNRRRIDVGSSLRRRNPDQSDNGVTPQQQQSQRNDQETAEEPDSGAGTNVFVTRRQFPRPSLGSSLKR